MVRFPTQASSVAAVLPMLAKTYVTRSIAEIYYTFSVKTSRKSNFTFHDKVMSLKKKFLNKKF